MKNCFVITASMTKLVLALFLCSVETAAASDGELTMCLLQLSQNDVDILRIRLRIPIGRLRIVIIETTL